MTKSEIPIFRTNQLFVRPLQDGDLDAFYEMESDPHVLKFVEPNFDKSKESIIEDLSKIISRYEESDIDFWVWAVIRNEDQTFIGTCAIIDNGDNECEIGYRIRRRFWGSRYGTEICQGLIHFTFTTMNVDKITAVVCRSNISSVKILDHFMKPVRQEYNASFQDIDLHYELEKRAWS